MSLSARTVRGAAWQGLATTTQAGLQLLVLAVLARHVTPREFGLVAVAQVFVGILEVVAEAGIWGALVQRPQLTPRHLRAAYLLGTAFPALLVFLFWFGAPVFAGFFHADELGTLLRVMSFYALLTAPGLVARGRLERDLDFRTLFWLDTTAYVFGYALVGVAGALLGWGVWALAGAILMRAGVFTLLASVVRKPDYRPSFGMREVRDLFGFGFGFTLSRLLDYLAWQADYLIVGRWLGVSRLGFYQRGFELMELPGRYLGKTAEKVLFASMAQIQTQRERLALAFSRSVEIAAILVVPVSAWMLVTAPELVRVLYGEGWQPVVPVLQILLVTPLFRTTARVAESLSRAVGVVYRNAWRKALSVVTVCLGSWIGQRWGIQGVACGAATAIAFNTMLLTDLALRATGLGWSSLLRAFLPGLGVSAVAGAGALAGTAALRALHAPPLAVLMAAGLGTAAALALAGVLRPGLFGAAGPWLLGRAAESFPAVRRFQRGRPAPPPEPGLEVRRG